MKDNQKDSAKKPVSKKEKNTSMAIIAYIVFFLPLLTEEKEDPYVKFHVKQGLVLFLAFIAAAIISFIFALIPVIGWLINLALYITLLILLVIGIMNAANGKKKELPLIGTFAKKLKI